MEEIRIIIIVLGIGIIIEIGMVGSIIRKDIISLKKFLGMPESEATNEPKH